MTPGYVNKIIPFSAVDGPGNRTAIFLQGCNFNCQYCHNPETINPCIHCGVCIAGCPAAALEKKDGKVLWFPDQCENCDDCIKSCPYLSTPKTRWMSAADMITAIGKGLPFVRGITVSGGEATLQRDFLVELFEQIKKLPQNLTTFLDSNGSYDFAADEQLMRLTDSVMLDVKDLEPESHQTLTGASNEMVFKNLDFLAKHHKLYEIRTVIYPWAPDIKNTIENCAEIIVPYGDIRYKLIKYRAIGVREEFRYPSPAAELMEELKKMAEDIGVKEVIIV